MKKFRIVVFGNKQITIEAIKLLKKMKDVELMGVIGCESEHDLQMGNPSVKEYCNKNKIEYFNPDKQDDDFFKIYKKMKPDMCFSLFYRNIFSKKYIEVPKNGFINVHPSLLPKYRGPVPSMWALLNKEELTGVTIHYIDEGVDTGDILFQKKIRIPRNITGFELVSKLEEISVNLMKDKLRKIIDGDIETRKQNHEEATYYALYNNMLRKIDWFADSDSMVARINTFAKPYAGAFTMMMGKKTIIWEAKKIKRSKASLKGPGRIVGKNRNGHLVVSTVDGYISLVDYEYSGDLDVGERFEIFTS